MKFWDYQAFGGRGGGYGPNDLLIPESLLKPLHQTVTCNGEIFKNFNHSESCLVSFYSIKPTQLIRQSSLNLEKLHRNNVYSSSILKNICPEIRTLFKLISCRYRPKVTSPVFIAQGCDCDYFL